MNVNPMTAACMICNNNGNQSKLNALIKLKDICDKNRDTTINIKNSPIRHFQWGLHSHCEYGIPCYKLDAFDNKCKNIVRHIEKRMIQIAMATDNDSEYHNILELSRGNFPAVYHGMERIRAYSKSNISKD